MRCSRGCVPPPADEPFRSFAGPATSFASSVSRRRLQTIALRSSYSLATLLVAPSVPEKSTAKARAGGAHNSNEAVSATPQAARQGDADRPPRAGCTSPRSTRTPPAPPRPASASAGGRGARTRAWRRSSPPWRCRTHRPRTPSRAARPPPGSAGRTRSTCTGSPGPSDGSRLPAAAARAPSRALRA